MSTAELKGDVLILACAISAGVHGALVPGHGLPFAIAAAALLGLVAWLTLRPGSRAALGAAVVTLGGLLGAYVLAVTAGLPVVHPHPEPVDGLAIATKTIEGAGLLVAAGLLRPARPIVSPIPLGLTALVASFSAMLALALASGHGAHVHASPPTEKEDSRPAG